MTKFDRKSYYILGQPERYKETMSWKLLNRYPLAKSRTFQSDIRQIIRAIDMSIRGINVRIGNGFRQKDEAILKIILNAPVCYLRTLYRIGPQRIKLILCIRAWVANHSSDMIHTYMYNVLDKTPINIDELNHLRTRMDNDPDGDYGYCFWQGLYTTYYTVYTPAGDYTIRCYDPDDRSFGFAGFERPLTWDPQLDYLIPMIYPEIPYTKGSFSIYQFFKATIDESKAGMLCSKFLMEPFEKFRKQHLEDTDAWKSYMKNTKRSLNHILSRLSQFACERGCLDYYQIDNFVYMNLMATSLKALYETKGFKEGNIGMIKKIRDYAKKHKNIFPMSGFGKHEFI